ncbi:dTDP-4-dehydrorhamnose reductase [Pseudohalocynthiibacter aestuariivivens]|nr:dTDP-4-dehydrorhamnose reductase [Pseudohalocynthiibacter aestuariivivens]QIE45230.1 dTDP-4-dehydrorhamnose reductase [Pseudohalocynthiibacter aestuariivivens]
MTILVFGRTGQVARELQRQSNLQTLGRDDVDLTETQAIRTAIEAHAPHAVINAAAYTAADAAETDEATATAVNAHAPGVMAQVCALRGIPFLHISTDYVFDGTGTEPWRESDTPSPLGAYGRSKLAGEDAVRAAGAHHVILRTAWVFSAFGSNFVKTMLRLAETHDNLRIVADQWGGPTPAADIADALLRMCSALEHGASGGTYHFAGQPSTNWADFARAIFAQTGRKITVEDIPSADYPTPAQRPLNSRLDCHAITRDFGISPPDWRMGLHAVLTDLAS